jgi:tRNA threonylcarbamoyladenosine biosynthesis protein TsaB
MASPPSRPPIPPAHPILALETATMCGSVALVENCKVLAEYSLDIPATHSHRLLGQIEQIRLDVGAAWPELAGIAVSLGPGSFTGLRIGLSMAKGLALAHSLPLLGISTLDGLARQVVAPAGTGICALLDARKQEVYAAFYVCGDNGLPVRTSADLVIAPEKLLEYLEGPVIMVGDGGQVYRHLFQEQPDTLFAPPSSHFPRAATVGLLAEEKLAGHDLLDPVTAVPVYVRASEAEINLRMKG